MCVCSGNIKKHVNLSALCHIFVNRIFCYMHEHFNCIFFSGARHRRRWNGWERERERSACGFSFLFFSFVLIHNGSIQTVLPLELVQFSRVGTRLSAHSVFRFPFICGNVFRALTLAHTAAAGAAIFSAPFHFIHSFLPFFSRSIPSKNFFSRAHFSSLPRSLCVANGLFARAHSVSARESVQKDNRKVLFPIQNRRNAPQPRF